MARVKVLLFCLCFYAIFYFNKSQQAELMCEVANVKVESEDGRTQMFEMKKIEPTSKGEACSLCSHPSVNLAPQISALKSQLILSVADKELSPACEDDSSSNLPVGLCTFNSDTSMCNMHDPESCSSASEELVEEILYKSLVPLATGDENIDRILGLGLVMQNAGNFDGAVKQYTEIIKDRPNTVAAYFGRGVAYSRKGVKVSRNAELALSDFSEVIERDAKFVPGYERRAEAYIATGQYSEALQDLDKVIELKPNGKALFARGVVHLLLENFIEAEIDFKKKMELSEEDTTALFYTGLSQFYRGKVRNSIEVFKEVLKKDPDHLDACTSLAQAFREVGNLRASRNRFNHSLALNPYHIPTLQLRGDMLYHSGEPHQAIGDFKNDTVANPNIPSEYGRREEAGGFFPVMTTKDPVPEKCVTEDPNNLSCQYMQALSEVAIGQFYNGVKTATKVMVKNLPLIKANPEFIKSHYLREYARYLHAHLDHPMESLNPEEDLQDEFKDHWLKKLPFEFQESYKEQPGIQPHIRDVSSFSLGDYPRFVQNLICQAHTVGWLMQVNSDGYTPNKRLNLAMGLSSIHIAQLYETKWRDLRLNRFSGVHTWRDLYSIATRYRRLVDPDQPVLWLDTMPDLKDKEGYKTDIALVQGSAHNIKTMPYFDLVFKLVKTMLEHYSKKSDSSRAKQAEAKEDIDNAKTCEDLLEAAKKHQTNQNGFVVSTQVPSTRKRADKDRLEGAMLVLTEDLAKQILFTIDVATTRTRTAEYRAEMDYIYNQLQDEIRRSVSSRVSDMDSVVNIIITMAYYFYNWMPLSKGSSVVAYSVALGLIMSVGRQVTGKLPTGKLLEMEAMLSGAPDAFLLVTKQWMAIKRISTPTTALPEVRKAFPTVRSVLEVLNVNTDSC